MFRASYSTGFRVPTFNQLFNGVTESPYTGAGVPDPSTCPTKRGRQHTRLPGGHLQHAVRQCSDLKPEESKMSNIGFVWQPVKDFSASVDLWDIRRGRARSRA